MRIGVVTFPGSLDDRDAQRAVRLAGAEPVALWHGTHDLEGVDAIVLPGGFSYGDYLRCGAIAARSPIMAEVIDAANAGVPVLGICNGFQILVEAHLLPGGLVRNDHGDFICRDQVLRVENASTAWTNGFIEGQEITVPLKNGEGGFIASDEDLKRLEGEGLVAFRYVGINPNGSLDDIAGLTNAAGNVVGLMPHPEHASEAGFGPDTRAAMRSGTDGLTFFTSVLSHTLARVSSRVGASPRCGRTDPSAPLRVESRDRRRQRLPANGRRARRCRHREGRVRRCDPAGRGARGRRHHGAPVRGRRPDATGQRVPEQLVLDPCRRARGRLPDVHPQPPARAPQRRARAAQAAVPGAGDRRLLRASRSTASTSRAPGRWCSTG